MRVQRIKEDASKKKVKVRQRLYAHVYWTKSKTKTKIVCASILNTMVRLGWLLNRIIFYKCFLQLHYNKKNTRVLIKGALWVVSCGGGYLDIKATTKQREVPMGEVGASATYRTIKNKQGALRLRRGGKSIVAEKSATRDCGKSCHLIWLKFCTRLQDPNLRSHAKIEKNLTSRFRVKEVFSKKGAQ